MKNRIAILDVGTNTFHILISEQNDEGSFESIHKEKIAVKLGKGGIDKNIITDQALKRAHKALNYFNELLKKFQVTQLKAIATSAVRNAKNKSVFLKMAKNDFNIDIEVIDGNREAELIYKGVKEAVKLDHNKYLIMDIGGGSVEFIICDVSAVYWKKSFEIGGQRLISKFHTIDPITSSNVIDLTDFLESSLKELMEVCNIYKPLQLIGASGAFDTLSEIYHKQHQIIGELLNENFHILPISAFKKIHKDIIQRDRNNRLKIPGMIEMRVDMIVVSSYLINFIIKNSTVSNIITSNFALKEGVISEMRTTI